MRTSLNVVRATVSMLHGSVTARRTVRTSLMNETAVSDKLCLCYCFTTDTFLTSGIIEDYLLQKSSDESRPTSSICECEEVTQKTSMGPFWTYHIVDFLTRRFRKLIFFIKKAMYRNLICVKTLPQVCAQESTEWRCFYTCWKKNEFLFVKTRRVVVLLRSVRKQPYR